MSTILQLREKLSELERQRVKLSMESGLHVKDIKEALATASIKPLEDIDANAVFYHAGLLKEKWDEHEKVLDDTRKLQTKIGEE